MDIRLSNISEHSPMIIVFRRYNMTDNTNALITYLLNCFNIFSFQNDTLQYQFVELVPVDLFDLRTSVI